MPLSDTPRVLPETIEEVITINDTFRRPDAPDSELWSFDHLKGTRVLYPNPIIDAPTLLPKKWVNPLKREWPPSKEVVFSKIDGAYPNLSECLGPNMVIAGGCVCWALLNIETPPNDVDIFFVGTDEHNIMVQAYEFMKQYYLRSDGGTFHIVEQYGLITIIHKKKTEGGDGRTGGKFKFSKIQLILRSFQTTHALLAGFDLGAASVATNLQEMWTTTRGAWCLSHNTEIVHPRYSSLTYERRLCKYFYEKKFAIAMPHLVLPELKEIKSNTVLRTEVHLQKLSLRIDRKISPMAYVGHCYLPDANKKIADDYDIIKARQHTEPVFGGIDSINYSNFISGNYKFTRKFTLNPEKSFNELKKLQYREKTVDFYIKKDVIVNRFRMYLFKKSLSCRLNLNLQFLRCDLKATGDEIVAVFDEIDRCKRQLKRRHYRFNGDISSVSAALAALIDKYILYYIDVFERQRKDAVKLVIIDDPSRQFSGSLNPVVEDPVEWYGEEHFSAKVRPLMEKIANSILVLIFLNGRKTCAICQCNFNTEDANVCKTACNHWFHLSTHKKGNMVRCRGLTEWFKKNKSCPICRTVLVY
jgi:hypothetical protein